MTRLHVVQVERLVVVVEVDPAGLPGDVVLPLVGVAQHRAAAGVVERGDAHRVDLGLVLDAELLLGLDLGGQAVGVPAEPALDAPAAHGLVARDDVLDVAGQQVAVVRQAVGERRAVVEDELVAAVRDTVQLLGRLGRVLVGSGDSVSALTRLFETARFSAQDVGEQDRREAIASLLAIEAELAARNPTRGLDASRRRRSRFAGRGLGCGRARDLSRSGRDWCSLPAARSNPPSTQRPRGPDGVPRIRAIAETIAAAEISEFERERGLRPLLAPIAGLRLARRGVDLERDPLGAEELLGSDLAELVDPQRPRSSDRAGGGTSRKAVEAMIGRLEQL